jgi:hypothetical protein
MNFADNPIAQHGVEGEAVAKQILSGSEDYCSIKRGGLHLFTRDDNTDRLWKEIINFDFSGGEDDCTPDPRTIIHSAKSWELSGAGSQYKYESLHRGSQFFDFFFQEGRAEIKTDGRAWETGNIFLEKCKIYGPEGDCPWWGYALRKSELGPVATLILTTSNLLRRYVEEVRPRLVSARGEETEGWPISIASLIRWLSKRKME